MNIYVEIIEVPPGFAPQEIREQWKKLVLPVVTDEEVSANPSDTRYGVDVANVGGFTVSRDKAIAALKKGGKNEAALYWTGFPFGRYLQFRRDVCRVIKVITQPECPE